MSLQTSSYPTNKENGAVITTVDAMEVKKFNDCTDWWDSSTKDLLHTLNKVRVPFMMKSLINIGKLDATAEKSDKPLEGLKILDVGCGAGYLSEALATLGAETTGLDAADNLILIAEDHMRTLGPSTKLKYITSTIEEYVKTNKNTFDVVFSSEVIEHVSNQQEFVNKCVDCVKPGGSVVITTINRTIWSKAVMLWFSEYMTSLIPWGTHEYEKFVTPDELTKMLRTNNCIPKDIEGFTLNPITKEWFVIPTTILSYAIHAIKPLN